MEFVTSCPLFDVSAVSEKVFVEERLRGHHLHVPSHFPDHMIYDQPVFTHVCVSVCLLQLPALYRVPRNRKLNIVFFRIVLLLTCEYALLH